MFNQSKQFLRKWLLKRPIRTLCWVAIGLLIAHGLGFLFLSADAIPAKLLNVDREKNFSTLFSASLLLTCAVLLRKVSMTEQRIRLKEQHRQKFSGHWKSLSLLFLLMALDELLRFHEFVSLVLGNRFDSKGIFYYDWVAPAIVFVVMVAIAYRQFVRQLPGRSRWHFLAAGLLYLSGVLGMEMITGVYVDTYRVESGGMIALLNGLEEGIEMFGAIAFIKALLIYLQPGTLLSQKQCEWP